MQKRLDLRSLLLGIVAGTIVGMLVIQSTPKNKVAPWQIAPLPIEIYKERLRQQIHQAAKERWTLTSHSPTKTHPGGARFPSSRSRQKTHRSTAPENLSPSLPNSNTI